MSQLFDLLAFTIERIRQHLALVLWVVLGMSIAVTLVMSLLLYVDAVYSRILDSRLGEPPYAYRFRYLGAWNGNISLADLTSSSAAVQERFVDSLNLPIQQNQRYVSVGRWSTRNESNAVLGSFALASLAGAQDLIEITAGSWSWEETSLTESAELPLLLPESFLFSMGLEVGDTVTLQHTSGQRITGRVAALWRAIDSTDPRWIFPPRFFEQVLIAPSDALFNQVASIETPIDEVGWFLNFDGSVLRTSEIDSLLESSTRARADVERVLSAIRLTDSPEANLTAFQTEVNALTQQLVIVIMPVAGLILYFISVVAGLLVTRQQSEDVKLRSRGMGRASLLTVHVLMWLVIVALAYGNALVLSPYLVQLVGHTVSFLDFSGVSSVESVVFSAEALIYALCAGLIGASSGLILAWRFTMQNIHSIKITSKQSTVAWWQRIYLDFATIALSAYVLYTLLQRQGIQAGVDTPFSDPLTFIAPTLFALGLTLLFLRILPFLLGIGANILSITSNIPLLMALRELNRSMHRYRGTLLMTAFTLSLVGFTASMASTLDQSLLDVMRYRVGTELAITTVTDAETESSQDSSTGETTQEVTGFNAPPVLDLLALEEVDYVSRMGNYSARMTLGGQRLTGLAIGIDREGLGAATYMREDYSLVPLGNMLNELAANRTGIILSRQVAEAYHIELGQEIRYQIEALGEWQSEIRATVVGFIDYFPTIDPNAQAFYLITSIAPIFEVSGTPLPFDVWVKLAEGVSLEEGKSAILASGFPVFRFDDPTTRLLAAQAEPARRGVLGFLSVGFVAVIVLTLIGAIIQSTASFQAQSAQLGAMRAMGLSSLSVRLYILLLQGFVAMSGVASGTAIGFASSLLFLPLFDFSGGLPPYQLRIAWDELLIVYGVFGAILVLVAFLMAFVLTRQQLAQAVKIGNL